MNDQNQLCFSFMETVREPEPKKEPAEREEPEETEQMLYEPYESTR